MQEFICPNGRMSINGACPIFEGDDGQVKDFNKPKEKNFFKFDFEKPTENAFEKADNIISKNIGAYNSFVQEKLGIPSSVQNVGRVIVGASNLSMGYAPITALAPFAIPFVAGAALNNRAEQQAVQQQNFVDAAAAKRNIQQYTSGGGDRGFSGPTAQAGGFASDGGPVSNQTGRGRVGF